MPARIIDGEALWRSDKLSKVEPPNFRAEYANMIPLALADGTFECNPRRVWSDVYAYNRPDIDIETVSAILDEFERVGLLTRKGDEKGKIWGFWVGIEARLPSESTRDRYKKGIGNTFSKLPVVMSESRANHDDIVPRLDKIRLDKIGTGCDFKNIAVRYRKFFHVNLSHGSTQKDEYYKACMQYGEDTVLKCFELWAPDNMWIKEKRFTYGLRQFYDALPALIESEAQIQAPIEESKLNEEKIKEHIEKLKAQKDAEDKEFELARKKEETGGYIEETV